MSDHVKISFPLERDEDGYPPEANETMWAVPIRRGVYRIDNIPFYARLISDGDVVSAISINGELLFEHVIEHSDNCTVRVIMHRDDLELKVRESLEKLGCKIEGSGTKGFFSVSFDKTNYKNVSKYLEKNHAGGILDYEESSLR